MMIVYFSLKTRDFSISDEDLQCGRSRGWGCFGQIRLSEGFPRMTQKYRKPSDRLEDFRALVPQVVDQARERQQL